VSLQTASFLNTNTHIYCTNRELVTLLLMLEDAVFPITLKFP